MSGTLEKIVQNILIVTSLCLGLMCFFGLLCSVPTSSILGAQFQSSPNVPACSLSLSFGLSGFLECALSWKDSLLESIVVQGLKAAN